MPALDLSGGKLDVVTYTGDFGHNITSDDLTGPEDLTAATAAIEGGGFTVDLTVDSFTEGAAGVYSFSLTTPEDLGDLPAGKYLWSLVATGTGQQRTLLHRTWIIT